MNDQFRDMFCGNFNINEKNKLLFGLAKQYHEETEAYDQLICSGQSKRGVSIPTTPYEHSLINRNAQTVLTRLRLEHPEINREELHQAISKYAANEKETE